MIELNWMMAELDARLHPGMKSKKNKHRLGKNGNSKDLANNSKLFAGLDGEEHHSSDAAAAAAATKHSKKTSKTGSSVTGEQSNSTEETGEEHVYNSI